MHGTMILTLVAAMLIASMPAGAHDRYGRARVGVGLYFGAPLYWGSGWGGYNPYYYYPPSVVYRPPLVFYDEHGNPVPNYVLAPGEPLVYYDQYGNPVPFAQPQAPARAPAQAQPQSQPQPGPTWFFCADSQSYYPYVQTCPSPWQRVAPHPPPPPQ
jgi:hypothetical protein